MKENIVILIKININPKQKKTKKTKHFNVAQIKDMQHSKKINSNKEKLWEAGCYPKLDVK